MVIVVCCLKYEYGYPERGFSFEYYNFLETLRRMDGGKHKVIHFPFDEIYKAYGREEMNARLVQTVKENSPDLVFFFLFNDEFKKETLLYLKNELKVTTFNWFADDHWRFYNFSRYWAPLFSYVSTTDSEAYKKYIKYGINNVIKTQWAVNHYLYKLPEDYDFNCEKKYDVTFVGQRHSNRKSYVNYLLSNNIRVNCWGRGWENGRVTFEEMVKIFQSSKINLNFSSSSASLKPRSFAPILFTRRIDMKLRFAPLSRLPNNVFATFRRLTTKQIKGRVFEIPGSGGFLLTENVENLGEYYEDGKEIVIFENKKDLLEKIKYYLENDKIRNEIAYNGYVKTIREHTYEARFNEIFRKIGLIH